MQAVQSKYGYTPTEQFFMLLITGITNFSCLPSLFLLYKRKMLFETFLGMLTMLSSFLYHSMDSIDMTNLFLTDLQWHRIDNIGAITCFMMLCSYLMDNQSLETDLQLNYFALFMTIICQEKAPWNMEFTMFPVLSYLGLLMITICVRPRKPKYNLKMLSIGLGFFACAIVGFFYGLDEYKDYLRIWHGCWHMGIGIGSFYIWQAKSSRDDEFTFLNLFTKDIKHEHIKFSYV